MNDEFLIKELELAKLGLNPVFGECSFKFNYAPVPYSNPKRNEFKKQLLSTFVATQFLYSHDVSVKIVIFMSLQKRLETPDYGDLDNYSKSICDSIKGAQAILFDDCQIQNLNISWIDSEKEGFEISFKGSVDDFILKPVEFYEMANGLFYPVSTKQWTENGPVAFSDEHKKLYLNAIWETVKKSKEIRHEFRMNSADKLSAFRNSYMFHPIIQGYHKNRLIDGGFKLFLASDWRKGIQG